jgi:tetratricopeptide (TPR) repeat protein
MTQEIELALFLGVLAHQAGRNDEAIELIEKAHREGGARAQSLNSLGMAYLASGRAREAKDDYVALAEKLALDGSYRAETRRRMAAARGVLYEDRDAMQDFEGFLARVARP